MKLRNKSPILICIDLQMGFLEEEYWGGGRNNDDCIDPKTHMQPTIF